MFAIQVEDAIHDTVSVLPEIAGNSETAVHLMMASASAWVKANCPVGMTTETHHRPTAIDVCVGDEIIVTFSAHVITGVVIHNPPLLECDYKGRNRFAVLDFASNASEATAIVNILKGRK